MENKEKTKKGRYTFYGMGNSRSEMSYFLYDRKEGRLAYGWGAGRESRKTKAAVVRIANKLNKLPENQIEQ
jgi:hypothetical protein